MKKITKIQTVLLLWVALCLASCDKNPGGGSGGGIAPDNNQKTILGVAYDAVSFDNLDGALVTLTPISTKTDEDPESSETTVNAQGEYSFPDIAPGKYNLSISFDGYWEMVSSEIDTEEGNPFVAFLPVPTSITTPVGGITGVVLDDEGNPLENANVAISAMDESITNGYFSSVTTNQFGQFFIGAVPLSHADNFKVRCMASGHNTRVQSNILILENQMVVVYFSMEEETASEAIFHEGWEGPSAEEWEKTGFWGIQANAEIYNQAYPDYVQLAPNDGSQGKIPNAYKGTKQAWYGDPETGNFMGEQEEGDENLSGGTGVSSNYGSIISPIIDLTQVGEANLNFWTWFEVESVNPNQYGYDIMQVLAAIEGSEDGWISLGTLNPYTDPIVDDRESLPYTSGGFNQAPVWKFEEFDLTSFAGNEIRIKFLFETRDELFNGFRGWFIDEIRVSDKGLPEAKRFFDPNQPRTQRNMN